MYKVVISDSKYNHLKFEFDFMEDAQIFIERALLFAADKGTKVEITKEYIEAVEAVETEGSEE